MTIRRINGYTYGIGSKPSSADLNTLDVNSSSILDKRSGQSDTLESVVSCSGSGRIVPTYEAGADADTTYALSSGISVINVAGALSADRTYTLSNTDAVAGDRVLVLGDSTYDVTVKNAAATTLLVVGTASSGDNHSRWGEFLFDGAAWKLLRSSYAPQQTRTVFTADGTYTVPPGIYKLLVIGSGGGGGGGGGQGSCSFFCYSNGGGGGGGAFPGATYVNVTPGDEYEVTIGTGGSGGTGGAGGVLFDTYQGSAGEDGSDGGDTTFGDAVTFLGAQGGRGAYGWDPSNAYIYTPGGGPVGGGEKPAYIVSASTVLNIRGVRLPCEGGQGSRRYYGSAAEVLATAGGYSPISCTTAGSGTTTPGSAGSAGTTNTGNGGKPGGGGGASAFGDGGDGGDGGPGVTGVNTDGDLTLVGLPGTAGGTAAGGGGGGGAGCGSMNVPGGAGGDGGDGVLIVIPIR